MKMESSLQDSAKRDKILMQILLSKYKEKRRKRKNGYGKSYNGQLTESVGITKMNAKWRSWGRYKENQWKVKGMRISFNNSQRAANTTKNPDSRIWALPTTLYIQKQKQIKQHFISSDLNHIKEMESMDHVEGVGMGLSFPTFVISRIMFHMHITPPICSPFFFHFINLQLFFSVSHNRKY